MNRLGQAGLRTLRSPALHFVLLGLSLYLGRFYLDDAPDGRQARSLTVGPDRIQQLRGQWSAQAGRPPDAQQEEWLIRQWIEDEILFRTALEWGLHRDDPGVCNRLSLNMRFLGSAASPSESRVDQTALCRQAIEMGLHLGDPVIRRELVGLMHLMLRRTETPRPYSRADLRDYLRRHADSFREPPRIRLSHVFFSRDKRKGSLDRDARQALSALREGSVDPNDAEAWGDPFLAGNHPPSGRQLDLERVLGKDFARTAMDLPPGQWTGPVASGYGLHLVWVHEKVLGRAKALEEVGDRVLLGLEEERAEQRLRTALGRLRQRWRVRIERDPASRERAANRGDVP